LKTVGKKGGGMRQSRGLAGGGIEEGDRVIWTRGKNKEPLS